MQKIEKKNNIQKFYKIMKFSIEWIKEEIECQIRKKYLFNHLIFDVSSVQGLS